MHLHQLQNVMLHGPRTVPSIDGESLVHVPLRLQVGSRYIAITGVEVVILDGQPTYVFAVDAEELLGTRRTAAEQRGYSRGHAAGMRAGAARAGRVLRITEKGPPNAGE